MIISIISDATVFRQVVTVDLARPSLALLHVVLEAIPQEVRHHAQYVLVASIKEQLVPPVVLRAMLGFSVREALAPVLQSPQVLNANHEMLMSRLF